MASESHETEIGTKKRLIPVRAGAQKTVLPVKGVRSLLAQNQIQKSRDRAGDQNRNPDTGVRAQPICECVSSIREKLCLRVQD